MVAAEHKQGVYDSLDELQILLPLQDIIIYTTKITMQVLTLFVEARQLVLK